MRKYQGPWRTPGVETCDYPGLFVHDGRVTGSITDGESRLPLWAPIGGIVRDGFDATAEDYPPHEMTADKMAEFLYCLLEQRGEFGRLICALADVERRGRGRAGWHAWWQRKVHRRRIRKALMACVATLDEEEQQQRGPDAAKGEGK